MEQVGLEGGLSREQEKHFRCEYGQCGFFSPRWERISVWRSVSRLGIR